MREDNRQSEVERAHTNPFPNTILGQLRQSEGTSPTQAQFLPGQGRRHNQPKPNQALTHISTPICSSQPEQPQSLPEKGCRRLQQGA